MQELENRDLKDDEAYHFAMQIAVRGVSEGGRKVHRRHPRFGLLFMFGLLLLAMLVAGMATLLTGR